MSINKDNEAKTLNLSDGRKLGYSEFGEPTGKPLFHFHGYPGSRLEGRIINLVAVSRDVRFISVDRPGMGLSDFKQNRTIIEWPNDVAELADSLQINQFAVEGVSGGGPYSLACAYKIPDRLTHVGVLSGVDPHWDPGKPWTRPLNKNDAEEFWRKFSNIMSEPDKKLVLNPRLLEVLTEELYEAFRQGDGGVAYERELYRKDWGFRLDDISPTVKVHLWHGKLDVNVPFTMGSNMARAIPNCDARFYSEEGHYSTVLNHLEEILKTLTA